MNAPRADEQPKADTSRPKKKRANMHDGIAVWCDCCSCEAEPYWMELGAEMGITFSDYEETEDTAQTEDNARQYTPSFPI